MIKIIRKPKYDYLNIDKNDHNHFLRCDYDFKNLILSKYKLTSYCDEGNFFDCGNKHKWFFKVKLDDGNFIVEIPLIRKNKDLTYNIYFLNPTAYPKFDDVYYYVDVLEVLKNLNVPVNDIIFINLDIKYTRQEKLEAGKVLKETRFFYNKKNKPLIKIKDYLLEKKSYLKNERNNIIDSIKNNHLRYCSINKNHLYEIKKNNENTYEIKAISIMKDAYKKNIDFNNLSAKNYARIKSEKDKKIFIDKLGLKYWLKNNTSFPITFIDFEWDRYLLPPFYKMKPLDVLCFCFTMYELDEFGNLKFSYFIDKGDCRKEFIEKLLNDISNKGTIFCYNLNGAEALRLKELALLFPKYSQKIRNILDRMVDISDVLSEGLIYDYKMNGNYDLKTLVETFNKISYQDIVIKDGMEAVYKHRQLADNFEENELIKAEIVKYCSYDSYSMYIFYLSMLDFVRSI